MRGTNLNAPRAYQDGDGLGSEAQDSVSACSTVGADLTTRSGDGFGDTQGFDGEGWGAHPAGDGGY